MLVKSIEYQFSCWFGVKVSSVGYQLICQPRHITVVQCCACNPRVDSEYLAKKGSLYRNVSELQNIIRQSSKERLQLERHLARATEIIFLTF
ncbi:hypothetical protein TNCV_5058851 [Trichonephila clavipes]|nr:hypothetical protein TNCV_5058851 [Trichonephila clavipes]